MKNTCEENHCAMQKKTNNCDIHVNQQGGLYLTAVHFQLLTNVNEEVESLGKPTKFFDLFETEKHSVNNNDEQDHRNKVLKSQIHG